MDPTAIAAIITATLTGLSGLIVAVVSAVYRAKDFKELKGRVKALEDENENLANELQTEKTEKLALQGRVKILEDENARLSGELERLKKRRGF